MSLLMSARTHCLDAMARAVMWLVVQCTLKHHRLPFGLHMSLRRRSQVSSCASKTEQSCPPSALVVVRIKGLPKMQVKPYATILSAPNGYRLHDRELSLALAARWSRPRGPGVFTTVGHSSSHRRESRGLSNEPSVAKAFPAVFCAAAYSVFVTIRPIMVIG